MKVQCIISPSEAMNVDPFFENDEDRSYFITKLSESGQRYDVRLYLFTLMLNHTHLVLETPRGNLSRFMQRLQTAYTMYFNPFYATASNRLYHVL